MRRQLGVSFCLVVLVSSLGWTAPRKPKKAAAPAPVAATAELERSIFAGFDQVQGVVGDCVVNAHEGNDWKQRVKAVLTLTGAGQVFAVDLQFEPADHPKQAEMKQCIEAALRSYEWPRSNTPLVTAERAWTFALE